MKIIAGQKSLALSNPLASSPDAFSVYTDGAFIFDAVNHQETSFFAFNIDRHCKPCNRSNVKIT